MIRALTLATAVAAMAVSPAYYSGLQWRMIGPFRGGRTVAAAGVPSQRGVYYIAPNNGGIWKSTDYGRTWDPIFDGQDTGSIGALAVAPSNPNILYAGSGEGLRRPDLSVGDGIYKSTDAGATWTHLGLRDGFQIAALAIDPRDPDRVFAAVLGHPYGANEERGLYRSTDGGASWQKVLGKDENTGAVSVLIDPRNPNVVYASLWASRNPPWRLRDVLQLYQNGGLYKSTDGGSTWAQLHNGLPAGIGRIGLTIAPEDTQRLYAWINDDKGCGIYRTSDAGANWIKTNSESRVCSRGSDFSGIAVDPVDRDVVYAANTQTYRSTDAGKTWDGLKGAPGGDDYHTIWIDPGDRNIILLASDQGATLSVNYGRTWSSWYNQPTAQFYHVITDDRFPYRVFGGQQESGSAEVFSRSDDGSIWIRYWHPVGASEYGYVAPDPLHPTIIYGAGGGTVSRYDETLQQTQDVSPSYERGKYRYNRTNPLVFSRADNRTLYLGSNVVFATTDGGRRWRIVSPDLTRENPGVPANLGPFTQSPLAQGVHRGVVYSLAPSYIDKNLLWAGTDDGWIWLTRDGGKHWSNVSPPGLRAASGSWSKISQIDSSHFDRGTAYVAVTRLRLDDMHPYIYRTHDFGAHWDLLNAGLPDTAPVDTVREDPKRRGLLFAGTENTVYFSIDDGANWQSLQLNLPSTSIRDLVVHGDDLVVGTHGRSFWILDDIAPLRELTSSALGVHLFTPATAYRVRRDTWTDTPLPPEEPAAKNPPDGAMIDYYLPQDAQGPVTIGVYDAAGNLVRQWASTDKPEPIDPAIRVPTYWVRPTQIPSAGAGMHRLEWDYRYADPPAVSRDYPISAIVHDTPIGPQGVLVLPGTYTVKLSADGVTQTRTFQLKMDPRVTTSQAALQAQFTLAERIVQAMGMSYSKMNHATAIKDTKGAQRYSDDNSQLASLLDIVESADAAPTPQTIAAVEAAVRDVYAAR
ncbi:MAG TPA: hypothetical protein VFO29_00370 [Candidatus Rubrimentiphilum sp.]|nr:hypothetical protein [Candidatus Rubrimentiphilum sp.]